jgi:hypothetical protein
VGRGRWGPRWHPPTGHGVKYIASILLHNALFSAVLYSAASSCPRVTLYATPPARHPSSSTAAQLVSAHHVHTWHAETCVVLVSFAFY